MLTFSCSGPAIGAFTEQWDVISTEGCGLAGTAWGSGCRGPDRNLPGETGGKAGLTPPTFTIMFTPLGPSTTQVYIGFAMPPVSSLDVLNYTQVLLHILHFNSLEIIYPEGRGRGEEGLQGSGVGRDPVVTEE